MFGPIKLGYYIEVSVPIHECDRSYLCVRDNDFATSYDFSIVFLNCSDSVVFLFFHLSMLFKQGVITNDTTVEAVRLLRDHRYVNI